MHLNKYSSLFTKNVVFLTKLKFKITYFKIVICTIKGFYTVMDTRRANFSPFQVNQYNMGVRCKEPIKNDMCWAQGADRYHVLCSHLLYCPPIPIAGQHMCECCSTSKKKVKICDW